MNMNFRKICLSIFLMISLFSFLFPVLTFAQGVTDDAPKGTGVTDDAPKGTQGVTDDAPTVKLYNPLGPKDISIVGFIKTVLQGVIKIAIPILALAIIYSGFLFVFARGNPEGISKAKDTLLYTLIGSAVLLGAYAIAELIESTLKAVTS